MFIVFFIIFYVNISNKSFGNEKNIFVIVLIHIKLIMHNFMFYLVRFIYFFSSSKSFI